MSVLRERTRQLLVNRPRTKTYADIARDTGVNIDFIKRMAGEKSGFTLVDNVEKLYTYLSGKPLEL